MSSKSGKCITATDGVGSSSGSGTTTSRFRDGLVSKVTTSATSSKKSDPTSPTSSSNTPPISSSRPPSSPSMNPSIPLRTSHSFTSSGMYHQQQKRNQQKLQQQQHSQHSQPSHPQQHQQQQQRRRVASYRTNPQSMQTSNSPSSSHTKHDQHTQQLQGTSSRWNFPGVSPNNSMDSEDKSSKGGSISGLGSIGITSSFDDCYMPATAGYYDAFALLENSVGAPNSANATTSPSAIRTSKSASPDGKSNSHGSPSRPTRRLHVPSSPRHLSSATAENTANGSPTREKGKSTATTMHHTIDGGANSHHPNHHNHSITPPPSRSMNRMSSASPPNTPPMSNTTSSQTLDITKLTGPVPPMNPMNPTNSMNPMSEPSSSSHPITATHSYDNLSNTSKTSKTDASQSMPPPPSASKPSKYLRNISPKVVRSASPLTATKMRQTLQKKFGSGKGAKGGGTAVSGAGSTASTGSTGTTGNIGTTKSARQRARGGSGGYSDAVTKALQEDDSLDATPTAPIMGVSPSASHDGIEVISPSNRGGGNDRFRIRNRSPSPIRQPQRGDRGDSTGMDHSGTSHSGTNSNEDDDDTNQTNKTNNTNDHSIEHSNQSHPDGEDVNSEANSSAAPSFFSGRGRNLRGMSPARVKKSLKKRFLAIPASPRRGPNGSSQGVSQGVGSPTESERNEVHPSSNLPQSPQSAQPLSPRDLPRYPVSEEMKEEKEKQDGNGDDGEEDGMNDMVGKLSLTNTSMSFDVDDYETSMADTGQGNSESKIPENADLLEDLEEEGDFHSLIHDVFGSREFFRAMGGANEASLATKYIQSGDALCAKQQFDNAVPAYYAGLGAILSRVRRWAKERRGEVVDLDDSIAGLPNVNDSVDSSILASNMFYDDVVEAAQCTEIYPLVLAMSSILLRAGNAHFRLKHWEIACRDYVSAQSYRSLRNQSSSLSSEQNEVMLKSLSISKVEQGDLLVEEAKLDGRISNNMASAQSKRQMYEEARTEYAEALRIKQNALHNLHGVSQHDNETSSLISSEVGEKESKNEVDDEDLVSGIATTLHNIGLLRTTCGEPKKAEKAYKQSLSLRVKKFGLDDLGVSSTLCALGDLYYELKQFDDAFRSYKESLRIWKLHCGKSDFKTSELYYNIGLVFYSKGPYSKAKISMVECLRIRRDQCGNESLHVATALYLLGLISSLMGDYEEALSYLKESLGIRQKLFGKKSPNHLLVLNVHLAIGRVFHLMGDFDFAMDSFAIALMGRTLRLGKHHPSVSEVLQAIGVAYTAENEYNKALETLEEALRLRQSLLGPSLEVAETLDSLSFIFFKSGDTEKAIELVEEALSVLKTAVGFDHVLVAKALKNMGDYYQDIEVHDEALEAYNESLRVMTLWHGRDHTFLSEILNEIGVTQFKKGEYMVAKQSFTEALRIMRRAPNGGDKSSIFPTLSHLGHALYKTKDLNLAAETYYESFNIQVSIITGEEIGSLEDFGNELNDIKERISSLENEEDDVAPVSEYLGGIASILRYLGLVYQEQGDIEKALTANKLSLSVRMCQPFKDFSSIALMAETIAMFEFKRNNLNSALDYFNQALVAKKTFQGDSTIDVARTVNNLANIHFSLGNLDDAMKLYQDALEIKRLRLGNDSDEVANTLNNIAHVMVTAGKEQEALKAYHDVVRIRQERYGKNHASVATTLSSMGDVYIKLGKLEIAMTYFEQCIRIRKLRQESFDERVLENLGSIYGKLGEWNKAETTFKEIIQIKRSTHGNDCLDIAKTLDLLAVSYIEQDRYGDSIDHLKEALRIRKVCLGGEDDEILASLNKLAFVYKSCGMMEQMMEVKDEFDAIQSSRIR